MRKIIVLIAIMLISTLSQAQMRYGERGWSYASLNQRSVFDKATKQVMKKSFSDELGEEAKKAVTHIVHTKSTLLPVMLNDDGSVQNFYPREALTISDKELVALSAMVKPVWKTLTDTLTIQHSYENTHELTNEEKLRTRLFLADPMVSPVTGLKVIHISPNNVFRLPAEYDFVTAGIPNGTDLESILFKRNPAYAGKRFSAEATFHVTLNRFIEYYSPFDTPSKNAWKIFEEKSSDHLLTIAEIITIPQGLYALKVKGEDVLHYALVYHYFNNGCYPKKTPPVTSPPKKEEPDVQKPPKSNPPPKDVPGKQEGTVDYEGLLEKYDELIKKQYSEIEMLSDVKGAKDTVWVVCKCPADSIKQDSVVQDTTETKRWLSYGTLAIGQTLPKNDLQANNDLFGQATFGLFLGRKSPIGIHGSVSYGGFSSLQVIPGKDQSGTIKPFSERTLEGQHWGYRGGLSFRSRFSDVYIIGVSYGKDYFNVTDHWDEIMYVEQPDKTLVEEHRIPRYFDEYVTRTEEVINLNAWLFPFKKVPVGIGFLFEVSRSITGWQHSTDLTPNIGRELSPQEKISKDEFLREANGKRNAFGPRYVGIGLSYRIPSNNNKNPIK